MKRKLIVLCLSGALICATGMQAMAADTSGQTTGSTTASSQEQQALPSSVLYYGIITEVGKDENGAVNRLYLESESAGSYIMNIYQDTVWIDSGNHAAASSDVKVGESVYVFHSPISTRSIPPQSAAYAVVRNIPQDAGSAMYHVVEKVSKQSDGSLQIVTDNGGLLLRANDKTAVIPYLTRNIVTLEDIKAGDRIMAWYPLVMLSYPGQAYADHIMLLPEVQEEGVSPAADTTDKPLEGSQLSLKLNGKVPNMAGRYENGVAMVPVAAVARDLGYNVTYTRQADGAFVTVESDTFSVKMTIGEDAILGVTKIEGAVGMTSPQKYGKAPYIVAPGTTWAPAELFTMLGKTVTLSGNELVIE